MKLRLLAVGQKMPDWVQSGYDDYAKRLQPLLPVQLVPLAMAKRGKNDSASDIHKYCQQEGQTILTARQPRERLIALEVGGRNLSTEKLADTLKLWHWSLSPLTLPHPIVRIIVIEQIYRAMSLINGHPYHRA